MSRDELEARLRTEAFRLLVARGELVSEEELASLVGIEVGQVGAGLDALAAAGRIRRDDSGGVIASAGLSIVPDRHEILLGTRRFWTWCAYDFLGIFGALAASGRARSPSPGGGVIEVDFEQGRPVGTSAVLFRPDEELRSRCENVYEEWCPNSNLFPSEDEARSWAEEHDIQGRVMGLDEASDLGTADWADVVAAESVPSSRTQ